MTETWLFAILLRITQNNSQPVPDTISPTIKKNIPWRATTSSEPDMVTGFLNRPWVQLALASYSKKGYFMAEAVWSAMPNIINPCTTGRKKRDRGGSAHRPTIPYTDVAVCFPDERSRHKHWVWLFDTADIDGLL